jgi:hypothetical protein
MSTDTEDSTIVPNGDVSNDVNAEKVDKEDRETSSDIVILLTQSMTKLRALSNSRKYKVNWETAPINEDAKNS